MWSGCWGNRGRLSMCRGGEKKGNEGGEERVCLVVVVCVCVIVLFQVGDLGSLFCKRLELSQKRQRVCLCVYFLYICFSSSFWFHLCLLKKTNYYKSTQRSCSLFLWCPVWRGHWSEPDCINYSREQGFPMTVSLALLTSDWHAHPSYLWKNFMETPMRACVCHCATDRKRG